MSSYYVLPDCAQTVIENGQITLKFKVKQGSLPKTSGLYVTFGLLEQGNSAESLMAASKIQVSSDWSSLVINSTRFSNFRTSGTRPYTLRAYVSPSATSTDYVADRSSDMALAVSYPSSGSSIPSVLLLYVSEKAPSAEMLYWRSDTSFPLITSSTNNTTMTLYTVGTVSGVTVSRTAYGIPPTVRSGTLAVGLGSSMEWYLKLLVPGAPTVGTVLLCFQMTSSNPIYCTANCTFDSLINKGVVSLFQNQSNMGFTATFSSALANSAMYDHRLYYSRSTLAASYTTTSNALDVTNAVSYPFYVNEAPGTVLYVGMYRATKGNRTFYLVSNSGTLAYTPRPSFNTWSLSSPTDGSFVLANTAPVDMYAGGFWTDNTPNRYFVKMTYYTTSGPTESAYMTSFTSTSKIVPFKVPAVTATPAVVYCQPYIRTPSLALVPITSSSKMFVAPRVTCSGATATNVGSTFFQVKWSSLTCYDPSLYNFRLLYSTTQTFAVGGTYSGGPITTPNVTIVSPSTGPTTSPVLSGFSPDAKVNYGIYYETKTSPNYLYCIAAGSATLLTPAASQLSAASVASDSFVATCALANPGVYSFRVYYGTSATLSASTGSYVALSPPSEGGTASKSITGLASLTKYYFAVYYSSSPDGTYSALSSVASCTTAETVVAPTLGAACSASAVGPRVATVSYSVINPSSYSLRLYYSSSADVLSGSYVALQSNSGSQTLTGLSPSTTYRYAVAYLQGSAYSVVESQFTLATTAVPTVDLSVTGQTVSSVSLRYAMGAAGNSAYRLYYSTTPDTLGGSYVDLA